MGNELRTITIKYKISRHHSERDLRDDALAAELNAAIRKIVVSPRYTNLSVSTEGLTLEFDQEQRFIEAMHAELGHLNISNFPLHDQVIYAAWRAMGVWREQEGI